MKFGKLMWMFDSQKVLHSKWGRKRKMKTIIIQSKDEAKFLYKMAFKYSDYNIIELGRKYGGSAVVMACAMNKNMGNGKLYSVDISTNNYEFSKKFIKDMRCEDRVEIVQGNTQEDCLDMNIKAAFILFDATHDYNIIKEFQAWDKHLLDGGYMFVHDYGMEKHPGVTKAVNEYIETHDNIRMEKRINRIAVMKKGKNILCDVR